MLLICTLVFMQTTTDRGEWLSFREFLCSRFTSQEGTHLRASFSRAVSGRPSIFNLCQRTTTKEPMRLWRKEYIHTRANQRDIISTTILIIVGGIRVRWRRSGGRRGGGGHRRPLPLLKFPRTPLKPDSTHTRTAARVDEKHSRALEDTSLHFKIPRSSTPQHCAALPQMIRLT